MKTFITIVIFLLSSIRLLAQLPTNSYAVTSACPGSANNYSTLQSVVTTGALVPIGTVNEGGQGLVINALGYDAANTTVIYGLQSKPLDPTLLVSGNAVSPTLFRIDVATAAATGLGPVAAPLVPATGQSAPRPTEIYRDMSLVLDFVGDGDASSNYYLGGVTCRVFYDAAARTYRLADVHFYVGLLPLVGLATAPAATATLSPDWHQVDLSDAPSASLTATYQANAERYLNSMGTAPIPDGGFQDWVYNTDRDELVAYIGTSNHFLTIANPATQPVARTTAVAVPIPDASGAPGSQNIGALFTDNLHNVYAISAQDGIIYQIDHLTGNYLGKSYGAFGCSRGDAVSLPGAMPITLTSFEAAPASNAVLLDWTTASEFGAASFEVQRSSTRANWTTIQTQNATVQAAGAAYRTTDAAPLLGLAYYRLALRYPDGRLAYSPVRTVTSTGTTLAVAVGKPTSSPLQVFPNPAHGSLAFTLPTGDVSTSVDLISATGQLARHYAPSVNGSTHSLDIQGLPKGFYLLRVQLAGAVRTARVVLAP